MKAILLSDCHLCVDKPVGRLDRDMLAVGLKKLNDVFLYAEKHGIETILQAGDFVDVKRSWELLSALTKFLTSWKHSGINLYCVWGQHDQYYHDTSNEKTIMGVLALNGLTTKLNHDPFAIGECDIYGCSYGEEVPKIIDSNVKNILVIHRQILMNKLWSKQEDVIYAPEFLSEHDFDLVLCGDAHQKFDFKVDKKIICNTGVMMRLEASENNLNHQVGFYDYDSERKKPLEFVRIESAKDGYEVLSRDHIEKQKKRDQNFDAFISKVQEVDKGNAIDFDATLQNLLSEFDASEDVRLSISEYISKGDSNGR